MYKENDSSRFGTWLSIWYDGVDFSLPGNGGSDCSKYLGMKHRLMETVLIIAISFIEIYFAIKFVVRAKHVEPVKFDQQLNGQALPSSFANRYVQIVMCIHAKCY